MPDTQQATPFEVTTGPLPTSRKVFVTGTDDTVRVPFREIGLHPSAGEPPFRVYDTTGPYTDPDARTDCRASARPGSKAAATSGR